MWEIENLLVASQLAPLVPLAAALLRYRRLDRGLKLIALMLFLSACTEAVNELMRRSGTSTIGFLHFWTLVEVTLIILAFACWQRSARVRRLLFVSIPLYLALVVLNKIFFETFDNFDILSRSVGSLILIVIAVYTFQRMIIEPGDSLILDPRFWVSSTVLIYHAGTLTIFTLSRLMLLDNPDTFGMIYGIVHTGLNILHYFLYAAGFLVSGKTD